ncbi:multidrug resistance-associated protein 1-like [Bufo gargarizans]|uniref:multidrug resistance-associated protein 1-like n=1 Tax=Bufo gargarizans TaxID=30331 RepID=UPI001CF24B67|nr:multidrug resistance-associated protein 1-like [Bufo gargarizans]XP_044158858.1 multidrug resistance-associated protein 1-like [Bufo gargarizans]
MKWLCKLDESEKFWDINQTWHTDNPDFSWCFHHTILYWIPCFYLFACSPFYIFYLRRHGRGYIRLSLLTKAKTCLSAFLALVCYTELFYTVWNMTHGTAEPPVLLISPLIVGATMILATCLIQYERLRGVRSSALLMIFWMLAVICAVFQLRTKITVALSQEAEINWLRYTLFMLYFLLVLFQCILSFFNDRPPFFTSVKNDMNPCPLSSASFLSQVTFSWFTEIMFRGYKQPLKEKDIWSLRKSDTAEDILLKFSREIQKEWLKTKPLVVHTKFSNTKDENDVQVNQEDPDETEILLKNPSMQMNNQSLLKIIIKSFGYHYLFTALLMILYTTFLFISPELMRLLLDRLQNSLAPTWQSFFIAVLLLICPCFQSLFLHQHDYQCYVIGMRLRSAIVGSVYKKALVISNAGRKNSSAGEIVNLISTDVQKLMDLATCLNYVWSAPITILFAMYFLWQTLGVAVFVGVAVFILNLPFMTVFAVLIKRLQEEQMKQKDGRIKLISEILQGIKVLKLYAWENAFRKKVESFRLMELKAVKKIALLFSGALALFVASPFWVSLSMFGVFLALDEKNILDAQKAFVTVMLLNILRIPLRMFPMAITLTVQSAVSLRRLTKFFSEEELEPSNVETLDSTSRNDIVVSDGTFTWCRTDEPCLRSINLSIQKGSLVAVVGQVGCGKSSLLSALLGEMEKVEGKVALKGSIAYVPQQTWTANATFKENVLFGRTLEKDWYNNVIQACALLPDLKILSGGEDTEIGEKGINLSGGQKQRVSIARAVYRNFDVYLLDDPLSAVDAHVGQHLFEHVIGPNGLLKGKTRVLVTHGVSFLPQVDMIIVMSDGRISEVGTYTELLEKNGAFSDFLQTYALTAEQNDESQTESKAESSKEKAGEIEKADNGVRKKMASEADMETAEGDVDAGKLTEADVALTGRVKLSVYLEYCRIMGKWYLLMCAVFFILQQLSALGHNYWIGLWADDPIVNGTQQNTSMRLTVYSILGVVQVVCIFIASATIIVGGVSVSRQLHSQLLYSILRSPLSFFERTPSGNLTNRFAKEMDTIDNTIPQMLMMFIMMTLTILEILLVIAIATPLAAVAFVPLGLLYFFLQRFYVASSRQLKRLDAVSKSPLYTHFNETLQGVNVIRAFREQDRFIQDGNLRLNTNHCFYFSSFVANRWLSVRCDLLSNFIVFTVAIVGVLFRESISPGLVGLAIVNSLRLTGVLKEAVHTVTDMETNSVSVERVKEYCDVEPEAPWTSEDDSALAEWPHAGRIEFQNYGLRYRKDLELALKKVTASIQPGEKIGIVGRTGAGKSSLTLGLFRILEPAIGSIHIDGTDIAKLGLHELRSKITIIPQDPVLFFGSLRMNLDPFDNYSDEEIWTALELAHLKSFASSLPDGLNHMCSEGGENLSVGQRQLVCLARAVLRKTKILVLDEATAAVDLETDDLIQSTIRKEFEDCTVITIAHRLNTIMDYTRIVVFDKGEIAEFDTPSTLLDNKGQFYSMAKDANII